MIALILFLCFICWAFFLKSDLPTILDFSSKNDELIMHSKCPEKICFQNTHTYILTLRLKCPNKVNEQDQPALFTALKRVPSQIIANG